MTSITPFVQRAKNVNRWFSKYYNLFGKNFQDLNLHPLKNFIARKQSSKMTEVYATSPQNRIKLTTKDTKSHGKTD